MNLEGAPESTSTELAPQRVAVVNLDMEFGTMVWFLVKLALAAIPAAAIIGAIAYATLILIRG